MTKIVAFIGAKSCGKSTAGAVLESMGYKRERFAGPLKEMLVTMGLSREQVDGSLKEVPDHEILGGKTPRWAMQSLGTEWREMIHTALWSDILKRKLAKTDEPFVLIDDLRFPHEFEAVKGLGGKIICIRRPDVEPTKFEFWFARQVWVPGFVRKIAERLFGVQSIHASELHWPTLLDSCDAVIMNDSTQCAFTNRLAALAVDMELGTP